MENTAGRIRDVEKRIIDSVTIITKAVWPNNINHHDTLFGGAALQWMDEVAFITATRFCRQRLVTVSTDPISFKTPIPAGTFVELVGKVVKVGNTSIKVGVEIFVEQMYVEGKILAVSGAFTFVALDDDKTPVLIR